MSEIRFDPAALSAAVRQFGQKTPQAMRRAIRKAGTAARAEMGTLIAADTGLPARKIKDEIRLVFIGNDAAQLTVQGGRLPLINFRATGPEPSRGKGRGVSYSLPGGRGRIADGFIATMPNGHRGVFRRKAGATARRGPKGWTTLPIQELRGPSIVNVFRKFLAEATARGQKALAAALRYEMERAA